MFERISPIKMPDISKTFYLTPGKAFFILILLAFVFMLFLLLLFSLPNG